MEQYIKKSALVAEIERRINEINLDIIEDWRYRLQREHDIEVMKNILSFLDTLEVKEIGIDDSNIDDLLEEDGIDPDSKDIKAFKECYYMALEKLKEKKGE